jgi:pimeloyl-ACP methyl ester carboxylesterase
MTEWVEVWRQRMGDLRGFILTGHSFGGFISGHYCLKYKKYVKKLLLLSPFGVPKRTFSDDEFDTVYEEYRGR